MAQKKLKAFSLVELLVVMAIIGILMGLALYGISAAQRNSRETERKSALQDISAGMTDYFSKMSANPTTLKFYQASGTTSAFVLVTSTGATYSTQALCQAAADCDYVPLKGAAAPIAAGIIAQTSIGKTKLSTTSTNSSATNYCFGVGNDGYNIAAQPEQGSTWWSASTTTDASANCP